VLLALVLIGCSSTCQQGDCLPHGTYIELNQELDTTSAQICFDAKCSTVKANEGTSDIFTGFNSDYWAEGKTVQLHLTVFDSANKVIDTLTESRTMDSSGCACGVLYYTWQDGHLHRKN
jgi:hypothetical protein